MEGHMSAQKKGRAAAPAKTTKPTAYGYIRVSHAAQAASGLGLTAQAQAVQDYYRGLLKRECRWGGVHKDAAVSASKVPFLKRAAGGKLAAALAKGDHLVIAKLDRAFRDTRDAANTLARWREQGIVVHILDVRVDTGTPAGRLIVDILSAVAAWESRRIGERIRDAFRAMRAAGKSPNGYASLGYRLRGKTRAPDPRERKIMGEIVRLRDKGGLIWREIGRRISAKHGKARDGRKWTKQRCWRAYHREKEIRGRRWPPPPDSTEPLASTSGR
jgi:putative DNA-invertase from lambdoid prophage Rac